MYRQETLKERTRARNLGYLWLCCSFTVIIASYFFKPFCFAGLQFYGCTVVSMESKFSVFCEQCTAASEKILHNNN